MTIWFDMDGTIADFYGVENWLDYLKEESTYPYKVATPLINMNSLARILNRLQRNGYEIGIVSWGSKMATPNYLHEIAETKIEWLSVHLGSVRFDHIDILPYGTPKNIGRNGILFDDEIGNRTIWGDGAYDVQNIIEVLKSL